MNNKTLFMAIGLPGSGKTTWYESYVDSSIEAVRLSTDDYLEDLARDTGVTYNDVFNDYIKEATSAMYEDLSNAIEFDDNIYWDQTNLTVKSRKAKLAKIPSDYRKVAVVFMTRNSEVLKTRLANRQGKTIPADVLYRMISTFELPTRDEGFDEIWRIET